MSRGFIKEGDQVEIPVVPPRAYLPKGMPNYVTKEGLTALNNELKSLENERVEAGENYAMSSFVNAKMKLLIDRINTAVEVDVAKADKETVSFGAYVKYNGRTVRIVGVDEADYTKGLLSFISPVAKALVGKKVGDTFEVKIPKGTETIEVQGIWYEAVPLTIIDPETDPVLNNLNPGSKKVEKRSQPVISTEARVFSAGEKISSQVRRDANTGGGCPDKLEPPTKNDEKCFIPEENIMEFLPAVNDRGIIVGRALFMELHNGHKILHPSIHLHIINTKGETVRRYWWHVTFGDTPEKTLKRKMSEALGISGNKPKLKKQYIRETAKEKELVYVYILNSDEIFLKTPEGKEYFDIFAKD